MKWTTHEVTNVVPELKDYNLYSDDQVLRETLLLGQAEEHEASVSEYGALLGQEQTLRWAEQANQFKPELHSFDRVGHRIDQVEFHESWHHLMKIFREQNLVSQPYSDQSTGAWSAYAAGFFMHGQIEAGTQCPNSMTFACIPVLQKESVLFEKLKTKLFSKAYDSRDLPIEMKDSILVGMGMTEKQGGSDVRSNTTVATARHGSGRGMEYSLVGHKWFFSAPMCDAHLVLARTGETFSCFYVPRFKPDGSKNAVMIQRLKNKLGNSSNSSCEVEFQDAFGILVGEEGRGIPTIIEMATSTRLHCVIGSAGLIRQCLTQALHYANHRKAFGKLLINQPLMRNILTDMALESEAATHLMMSLARSFEQPESLLQRAYQRILTPASKFWVCKRGVELAGEAMEVFGGNGYVEDAPMARIFRDMPVNSIWEGSGNVMCLDVLRAITREGASFEALMEDLESVCSQNSRLKQECLKIKNVILNSSDLEATSRGWVQQLVLLVQAALLLRHSPHFVSDAFIASRFDSQWGRVYGVLPSTVDQGAILQRARGQIA
jgi:putative acyl-CoA dehydrogenase